MYLVRFAWVIRPSVMAFGKHGDRIYVAFAQHVLKLLFGKLRPDPGDRLGSMKIQMYLTKSHCSTSNLSD
jgi:hypothetical protein